ncbi:integrase core domain-containing protein [Leisingera sp. NJS204]|uniref:integrase core domain-containing protein n=1 Tax=Leisingera sp. NJS204 TaxID=2508307 RepID=UPI003F8D86E2
MVPWSGAGFQRHPAWCSEQRIELHSIASGKPVQNGFVERFKGRLRLECDL